MNITAAIKDNENYVQVSRFRIVESQENAIDTQQTNSL